MTIISVMAPPPIKWKGWGHVLQGMTDHVKAFLWPRLRALFFPTHWPLGQDPPKAFLFRVFLLNSFPQDLALDCLARLLAPI